MDIVLFFAYMVSMKTVLISGASSGIGQELAQHFHQAGWFVFMVARRKERLQALKDKLPHSDFQVCDLTQTEDIQKLSQSIEKLRYPIAALINNAGVYQPKSLEEDDDEVWDQHYQCNLMSAVRLTRQFWPLLKANKGVILNISSTLAIRPILNTAAYSALKAAMNNWTLSLAIEGAPHGLRANAICPGIIETPIHNFFESTDPKDLETYKSLQKLQPLGRTGKPQDIAPMALELCSPHSAWITGNIVQIDGGILLNS